MSSRGLHCLLLLVAIVPIYSQSWQDDPNTCGLQPDLWNIEIVGGEEADDFEWPWQAALYRDGRRICGASVIDELWVITAAHCIAVIFEPEIFQFRVGSNSLANDTRITEWRTAAAVYIHPEYDGNTFDNDIALLEMGTEFTFWPSDHITAVCLPTEAMDSQFETGQNATVTGWGALEEGGSTPDKLYEVVVPIYSQSLCNSSYEGAITDNMICAGVPEGGVDSCQGDSGGPMVSFSDANDQQYYLIGIVSWGQGCARPGFPGVYTRVTQYQDWISPIFNNDVPEGKNGNCTQNEFLCRGGICIPDKYRCDGINHCYFGTDEEFCDGLLKMFDVYYYSRITTTDVIANTTEASKEECANRCLEFTTMCYAFDVTPTGDGNYICQLAGTGFNVEQISNENRTFNHFVINLQVPGAVFAEAAGVIASPSYIDGYLTTPAPGSETYIWTVMVDLSYKDSIRFTILNVTGESNCEELDNDFALLSINGANSIDKTAYCLNSDVEGAKISMPTTKATVELATTDGSTHGFLLEYTSYYDCNNEYTVSPGAVMSPNYPLNYPSNVKCTTQLQAPEGLVVYFSIEDMSIEPHTTCIYDSLRIYNGSSEDDNLLGNRIYCGNRRPTTLFQSSDRDMLIVFQSDGADTYRGFSGSYYFDTATFGTTTDPKIKQIENLENELSGYKFGIAGACVLAALLIMTLSASLYTVNKRDAENIKLLNGDLNCIENGDECDGETKKGRGYSKMEEEEEDEEERSTKANRSHGSTDGNFSRPENDHDEVREGDDGEDEGEVNKAFRTDENGVDSDNDNLQVTKEEPRPTMMVVEAEVNHYHHEDHGEMSSGDM